MSEQPILRIIGASDARYVVPPGRSIIGRHPDADLRVDSQLVGRRHAELLVVDGRVLLTDLQSTNGTWVNDRRLAEKAVVALRNGDIIRLGDTRWCFDVSAGQSRGTGGGTAYDFGDVGGSVQTGSGVQHNVGRDQYVATGHMSFDQRVRIDTDYDPSDELFMGAGFGRFLLVIGTLIAFAGFGLFVYPIFKGFGDDDPFEGPSPFDLELVPGVPIFAAGFAAFAVGGVTAAIGAAMSKAKRKRLEQDAYRRSDPSHGRPR